MNEPLKIVTTAAMQGVFEKLGPTFTTTTGYGVALVLGPPSKAIELVQAGEAADLVISTPDGIETLVAAGKVDAGSNRTVARMQMGLAVGANEPKPAIATVEQFKQALLGAKSLIRADPRTGSPSAKHFIKVIGELGITDAIERKTTARSGVVAHAVASGECAMAVQQLAELMLVDGIHILGPFPAELQNYVPLAAGIHAQSAAKAAARTFVDMLTAPEARPVIEQAGLLAPV
jgi:molybdate transport system substrate-binding protein